MTSSHRFPGESRGPVATQPDPGPRPSPGKREEVAVTLVVHPQYPAVSMRGLAVDVREDRGRLSLTYRIDGAERVVFPMRQAPTRTDDLWRTTCFELFLQFDDGERYVEFNFSPSTRWAAYAFDGYRDGMTALDISPPVIERTPDGVAVTLDLTGLPRGEHRMALAAVIEEEGGIKSFWSLAHPPGAPDFHAAACFAARLPAPGAA